MLYDENNIYALMTEKFRTYNKIQGVELPEDFYMFWQTTFKVEYESAFALFLAEDNSILAQTIIKIFSISMGEINNIKSQLSAIKIDTTKLLYKQEILNQKRCNRFFLEVLSRLFQVPLHHSPFCLVLFYRFFSFQRYYTLK